MDIKKFKEQMEAAKADIAAYKASRSGAAKAHTPANKNFAAIEKKAVSKWGVKNLNALLEVNTSEKRYKYIPESEREAVRNLKEASDVAIMCAKVFGKKVEKTAAYRDEVVPALKAFGIDSGDAGYEWIPTGVATSYLDEYNLECKVSGLFQEIKMPHSPYEYPVLSGGAVASLLGEAAAKSTKDTFTSSVVTLTAKKLSNQYLLPEELQEDSAVDVMKVIRQELIEGQEKAMEIAILEGDITSTHQHTTGINGSTPAADSPERAFKGLRKLAIAGSYKTSVGTVLNESHLRSVRKAMGKFAVNPSECAIICGPIVYNQLQDLDDVRTLDQYGPSAPVITGELAKYEGMPVIVSEHFREDTDSTGVNGGSGNTKTGLLMVNRKRHLLGIRRAVQVKVAANKTDQDAWDMVSFSRKAFVSVASEANVHLLYNITQ